MEEKPSLLSELFTKYHELVMYSVFGVTTTIVSWGVYALFTFLLPFNYEVCVPLFGHDFVFVLNIVIANIISWVVAVIVAFVTNKIWVFQSKSWKRSVAWPEWWTFLGGRLLTGAIENLALPLLVGAGLNQTLFRVEGFPAKIIVTVAVVILNYTFSKFVSFRHPKPESGSGN